LHAHRQITAEDIIALTRRWQEAVVNLTIGSVRTKKEFSETVRSDLDSTATAVRSRGISPPAARPRRTACTQIAKHITAKTALAQDLLRRIDAARR
jgi:hypothetical protein